MSQADHEHCTEPELHLDGEVECWGCGVNFWCPMHRLPLSQRQTMSHNSLLSQPSSLLGTPGAVLGMPQVLLHLCGNPTSHLESTWASRATAATFPPLPAPTVPPDSWNSSSKERNCPNLTESQLQGQEFPPFSWNSSSNSRNSLYFRASQLQQQEFPRSQGILSNKKQRYFKNSFFFCQKCILFCWRQGRGNEGPKGECKVEYRNLKNLVFRPVTHCWNHTQVLSHKPMCFESWFQVSASNFLERFCVNKLPNRDEETSGFPCWKWSIKT